MILEKHIQLQKRIRRSTVVLREQIKHHKHISVLCKFLVRYNAVFLEFVTTQYRHTNQKSAMLVQTRGKKYFIFHRIIIDNTAR